MLFKFRPKEAHDVTLSLISCTNLKISGAADTSGPGGVAQLSASFLANNETIPFVVNGVARNMQVTSKPLLHSDAVNATALWGNDKQAYTSAQFSFIVPKKKSKTMNVTIQLGLIRGEVSSPIGVANLDIDPTCEDRILTLPVKYVTANPTRKKITKLFPFLKKKAKPEYLEPNQSFNNFESTSPALGALLNVRVQVEGNEGTKQQESTAINMDGIINDGLINDFILEDRHDIDTNEKDDEDDREEICSMSKAEDIPKPEEEQVNELVEPETNTSNEDKFEIKSTDYVEVFQGFSCGGIFSNPCRGEVEDCNSLSTPQDPKVLDKSLESDLKEVVENVRNELELGRSNSDRRKSKRMSYEDDEDSGSGAFTFDASTVGTYTVDTYTYTMDTKTANIHGYIGLGNIDEESFESEDSNVKVGTVQSRAATRFTEDDTAVSDEFTDLKSFDDTYTAFDNTTFDNYTAFTEDANTAFGGTFVGGNIFM